MAARRFAGELLPCPKCGNKATIRSSPAQVMCSSWVCAFHGDKARTMQQAADLWNGLNRSDMPKKPSCPLFRLAVTE